MQRYFVSKNDIVNNIVKMNSSDSHHIKDVMRKKVGDKVIILDNTGKEYLSTIINLNKEILLEIEDEKINTNELTTKVTIAHSLVRKDKIEEVVKRLVELGCFSYINILNERINVNIKKKEDYKISRLQTIVKEASEQSERAIMMNLDGLYSFKELISLNDYDYKFVCYENSGRTNSSSLFDYLQKIKGKRVLICVGPEGGYTDKEIDIMQENGFICIGLGKRILRTETAPLMVMSIISAYDDFEVKNEN